jgi:hypothetical protein
MNTALKLAEALDTTIDFQMRAREAANELRRLQKFEAPLMEWLDKTEWVQATSQAGELGMHRADVLKQRINRLTEVSTNLLEALNALTNMAESFPDELHKDHPDVIAARAAIANANPHPN